MSLKSIINVYQIKLQKKNDKGHHKTNLMNIEENKKR